MSLVFLHIDSINISDNIILLIDTILNYSTILMFLPDLLLALKRISNKTGHNIYLLVYPFYIQTASKDW